MTQQFDREDWLDRTALLQEHDPTIRFELALFDDQKRDITYGDFVASRPITSRQLVQASLLKPQPGSTLHNKERPSLLSVASHKTSYTLGLLAVGMMSALNPSIAHTYKREFKNQPQQSQRWFSNRDTPFDR